MVFNGDADDQDICSLADILNGTNDIDFPLKEKSLYANWGLRAVFAIIWKVYGGWNIDDSNNSGNPEVTANLVSGTQTYPFATAQMLFALEYQDQTGIWNPLKPITLEEINAMGYAESNFMTTNGLPMYYRPVKNGVKLYPAANFSVTSGLKAHINRDISPFTPASTSTSPGFDSSLHEAIAVFMAYRFASAKSLASLAARLADWIEFAGTENTPGKIGRHYMQKFKQEYPNFMRRQAYVVEDYVS